MAKCKNCNVEILDETEVCPLCHSILEQNDALENMYPNVRFMMRKLTLISRIYLFCAILLQAGLFCINWLYFDEVEVWWSAISGLSLLYVYVLIRYAILGTSGYKSKVLILSLIAVLSAVAIDLVTGFHGWSLDYVLPSGIVIMDGIILFCMAYNHRNWQSYIMWQILMLLVCVAMLILYLVGIITNPYVMGAAGFGSLFLFLGTLIIGDRRARVELHRRFHIR